MQGDYMNRGICAVCDQILFLHSLRWAKVPETFAENCKQRLKPRGKLPQGLVDNYDISAHINCLSGTLISPREEIMKEKQILFVCVNLVSIH